MHHNNLKDEEVNLVDMASDPSLVHDEPFINLNRDQGGDHCQSCGLLEVKNEGKKSVVVTKKRRRQHAKACAESLAAVGGEGRD